MMLGAWTPLEWLALAEHELLLFAGVFFLIGLADELVMDITWAWLRLTGRARTLRINRANHRTETLGGPAALLIPAWQEERVLAITIAHALSVWPQRELRIYVGCYRNDDPTAESVLAGARNDPRVRLVVHDRDGPTTKADCLNRLYAAMEADERRRGMCFRMVLQHDAEDMVDSAALGLLDAALAQADFVQLPVLPQPQVASRWIGSHYRNMAQKQTHRVGRLGKPPLTNSITYNRRENRGPGYAVRGRRPVRFLTTAGARL
uniref:glycosyltransferase n=1 Tax=Altererythrobacter segetis TaxID=1104773 RepID=UPI001408CC0A|nr:glycosyltransferase [Altererythrobacter segetis]